MTEEELKEIEKRANVATPGPWYCSIAQKQVDGEFDWAVFISYCNRNLIIAECFGRLSESTKVSAGANALFVSRAREDVPALCAEVRRLRKLTDGTPLVGCEKCSFSARPKDIIKGMCPDCAERRIEWLESWQRRAAELFNEPDAMLRLEQWKRVRMLLSELEGA